VNSARKDRDLEDIYGAEGGLFQAAEDPCGLQRVSWVAQEDLYGKQEGLW
jgi:hypothetical protein